MCGLLGMVFILVDSSILHVASERPMDVLFVLVVFS
jgi:hypothetical protein